MDYNDNDHQTLNQEKVEEKLDYGTQSFIIKHPLKINFTLWSNKTAADNNLSWKATGLLSYLVTLPDNWRVVVNHLATVKKCGIKVVRSALKELEKNRYICSYQPRDDQGRMLPTVYVVFSIALSKTEMKEFKKSLPRYLFRHAEKRHADNGTLLNTNSNNTNKNKKEGKPPKVVTTDPYEIKLTEEERSTLHERIGEDRTKDYIEALYLHLKSIGKPKKYKCHYSAILNWYQRDAKSRNTQPDGTQKPIKQIEGEKKMIENIQSKYFVYRENCSDLWIIENFLEVEGDYILDKKRNYRAKSSLSKYVDRLLNGGYVNVDSFKIFAQKEFNEASSILNCSNMGNKIFNNN